jgi:fido (protein-threonine AMPylation protein)
VPIPWNADPPGSEPTIRQNLVSLLRDVVAAADAREAPSVTMGQEWHRRIYQGIPLPVDYYAGEIRDSDPNYPELHGYEVAVGPLPGVPSAAVPAELEHFEGQAGAAVHNLDAAIAVGQPPGSAAELQSVLTLCALLHGEWVRIHPFANGNGRTARLWANWAALRYGLPPFVTLRPRPGNPYAVAARASMTGSHALTPAVFQQMLHDHLAA